jgi:phosphoribosylamine--glycine ligase
VHCAPGNPGIASVATCHPVATDDAEGLLDLTRTLEPGLVVISPEAPLVAGVADVLRASGYRVFGPGRQAARLEGSKAFAKEVMRAAGVPTARAFACTDLDAAREALDVLGDRSVVKADGLAAGKGVLVCDTRGEAEGAVRDALGGAFGEAGHLVLIEERLDGEEVSLLALCHGTTCRPLAPAQDRKRIGDGDTGPNTGGMGATSPVPALDDEAAEEMAALVHRPVLEELGRHGIHFSGCLYAGLMLTADGPRVLEFNVRFGDPETQALVPRMAGDLGEALLATAVGELEGAPAPAMRPDACVAVVLASAGYPGPPRTGTVIEGVDEAAAEQDVWVFQAGTARRDGRLVTAGGRVLTVSAIGPTLEEAHARAYAAADLVRFDGRQLRRDIGARPAGA